jgi:predicted N-acetyltransferase YhbS
MTAIRPALPEDAAAIETINAEALGYAYGDTAARLRRILQKPNDRMFAAVADGNVVGYIHGSDYDRTYGGPQKNVLTLAVLPAYQGRGVGRMLLERLERWAKDDGCAGVRLVSGFDRAAAHGFYLRCGYTDRKDQKNFVKGFSTEAETEV